jgi:hypothetical protein
VNVSFSSKVAPLFADWNAFLFQAVGILRNDTLTPLPCRQRIFHRSSFHKSSFWTRFPLLGAHPCCSQHIIFSVAPPTTYSESVAITTLRQLQLPSVDHSRKCSAAIKARSSAGCLSLGMVGQMVPLSPAVLIRFLQKRALRLRSIQKVDSKTPSLLVGCPAHYPSNSHRCRPRSRGGCSY